MDHEFASRASSAAGGESPLGLVQFGSGEREVADHFATLVERISMYHDDHYALAAVSDFGIERVAAAVELLFVAFERGEQIDNAWGFVRTLAANPRRLRAEDDAIADAIRTRGSLPHWTDRLNPNDAAPVAEQIDDPAREQIESFRREMERFDEEEILF